MGQNFTHKLLLNGPIMEHLQHIDSMNAELKFLNNREKKKFKKIATLRKKSKGTIEDVVCQILPDLIEDKIEKVALVNEATQKDEEETEVKENAIG